MSMTLQEIQAALGALRSSSSSPRSTANFHIEPTSFRVYFRPLGWETGTPFILGNGKLPEDALADATKQWTEMRDRVECETLKKMALAIIRITHEQGCCTDAALRSEFGAEDVKAYCAEATILANSMADNGPFSVVELEGANAA